MTSSFGFKNNWQAKLIISSEPWPITILLGLSFKFFDIDWIKTFEFPSGYLDNFLPLLINAAIALFEGPKADSLAESLIGSLIFFIWDNPPTYFKLLKFLNLRTIFL